MSDLKAVRFLRIKLIKLRFSIFKTYKLMTSNYLIFFNQTSFLRLKKLNGES